MSFIRKGHDQENDLIVVCNFSPAYKENYLLGVHQGEGYWRRFFNSDNLKFGGSHKLNDKIKISDKPWNFKSHSAIINLAPLSVMVFKISKP